RRVAFGTATGEPSYDEAWFARRLRRAAWSDDIRAYGECREFIRVCSRSIEHGDCPARAHDGHPVREILHVPQLVGNENDRGAALRDLTHCGEEALGFAFGEHRGRLVENENARARNQHL